MKEIHRFQDVVLLSDKEVKQAGNSRVWFVDGSVADLEQLTFLNRGIGEIKFQFVQEEIAVADTKSETFEFKNGRIIDLQGGDLYFEIQQIDNEVTLLELIGTDQFHSAVQVHELPEGLLVKVPQNTNSVVFGDVYINGRPVKREPIQGKMIIKTHAGASLRIQCNGCGLGRAAVPLQQLALRTSGSLRLDCNSVSDVDIQINGSSHVNIQDVNNSCDIRISGSGIVNIASGNFSKLKAVISGSGIINAAVTVQKAELTQTGSGLIYIAHISEESYEVHGGSGSVMVLSRG